MELLNRSSLNDEENSFHTADAQYWWLYILLNGVNSDRTSNRTSTSRLNQKIEQKFGRMMLISDDCLVQVLLYLNISNIEHSTSLVNKQWSTCSTTYYALQHCVHTSSKQDNNAIQQLINHIKEHGYHNIHKQLLLSEYYLRKKDMIDTRYKVESRHTLELTDCTEVTGVYNMHQSIQDDSFVYDYLSCVLFVPQESKLLYCTTCCIESMMSRYSSRVALETRKDMNTLYKAIVEWSEYSDQEYIDRFQLSQSELEEIKLYRDMYMSDNCINRQEYEEYRDEILSAYHPDEQDDGEDVIWKNKVLSIGRIQVLL
jgi:hypothetical protein